MRALKLYGGPAIIVDFGTGTVFDAVTADGEYLGGAIAPGITVARRRPVRQRVAATSRGAGCDRMPPLAKNTVHALQSGLVLGYAEMVRGMVARFDREMGGGCKVVATGGLADLIAQEADVFDAVNPDLTLAGLRIIHELNP